MSFVLKIDHKKAAPEPTRTVGIRVRHDAPRNTIECHVKYRVFLFEDGKPAIRILSRTEIDRQGKSHTTHQEEHQCVTEEKIYCFSKRGGQKSTVGGKSEIHTVTQPIRFLTLPVSVINGIVKYYGDFLDVREAGTTTDYLKAGEGGRSVADTVDARTVLPGARRDVKPTRPEVYPERNPKHRDQYAEEAYRAGNRPPVNLDADESDGKALDREPVLAGSDKKE